jgi:uncharacterized protein (DUF983 family)
LVIGVPPPHCVNLFSQAGAMPEFLTMVDRLQNESSAADRHLPSLPGSGVQAALRGARNRCPSCGEGALFGRFLKPIAKCESCGQDWTHQQADDFPAYLAILVTGHVLAPLIIALVNYTDLPVWGLMVIIVSLALISMLAMLQPAKGAIIAVQWWLGMHGFVKPARAGADPKADAD